MEKRKSSEELIKICSNINMISVTLRSIAQEKASDPRLIGAAAEGDVSILMELLGEDPFMLDDIDSIPFVTTPLHISASLGGTHFSLEVMMLKPSFGFKLDPTRLSPLHLSVTNGHAETVRRLMGMNKELVRVKGKDGLTPLHYAVVEGRFGILDEMLTACPESLGDLTTWGDTALHLAVKRNQFKTFVILLEHTFLLHKIDVFQRKDEDGFTVLHHLILGTHLKMTKLLFSYYPDGGRTLGVNFETGGNCQTALDILEGLRHSGTNKAITITKIRAILSRNGALRANNNHFLLWMNHYMNAVKTHPYKYSCMRVDVETRNAMLVVAALINTIAFQVGVNPPGGYWQDTTTSTSTSAFDKDHKSHLAGTSVLATNNSTYFQVIIFFNMLAYISSLFMIIYLTRSLRMRANIITSLFSMTITYLFSIMSVSSFRIHPSSTVSVSTRVIGVTAIAGIGLVSLFMEPVLTKIRLQHRSKVLRQRLAAEDDDDDCDHGIRDMDGKP